MISFKNIISVITIALVINACSDNKEEKYKVENFIKKEDINKNLEPLFPYVAKLEGPVNYTNRFEDVYKPFFQEQQKAYKFSFERYFITPDSTHYFLLWKIAPSIYEKKIAIGGRYKKDSNGKIYAFEELFNTPKMKLDELKSKSFMLYEYMVENGSVDKFYGDYLLVEFPDANCVYDTKRSRWLLKPQLRKMDSLDAAKKADTLRGK